MIGIQGDREDEPSRQSWTRSSLWEPKEKPQTSLLSLRFRIIFTSVWKFGGDSSHRVEKSPLASLHRLFPSRAPGSNSRSAEANTHLWPNISCSVFLCGPKSECMNDNLHFPQCILITSTM